MTSITYNYMIGQDDSPLLTRSGPLESGGTGGQNILSAIIKIDEDNH